MNIHTSINTCRPMRFSTHTTPPTHRWPTNRQRRRSTATITNNRNTDSSSSCTPLLPPPPTVVADTTSNYDAERRVIGAAAAMPISPLLSSTISILHTATRTLPQLRLTGCRHLGICTNLHQCWCPVSPHATASIRENDSENAVRRPARPTNMQHG